MLEAAALLQMVNAALYWKFWVFGIFGWSADWEFTDNTMLLPNIRLVSFY